MDLFLREKKNFAEWTFQCLCFYYGFPPRFFNETLLQKKKRTHHLNPLSDLFRTSLFFQVLKFNDSEERDSHVVRLQTFLQSSGIEYSEREVSVTQLLEQANTKEMRDELLKRFFKTALAAVSFSFSVCKIKDQTK